LHEPVEEKKKVTWAVLFIENKETAGHMNSMLNTFQLQNNDKGARNQSITCNASRAF
jgi:hypothetical protein